MRRWIFGLVAVLLLAGPTQAVTENFCRTFRAWQYCPWIDEANPSTFYYQDSVLVWRQNASEDSAAAILIRVGPWPEEIFPGEVIDSVKVVAFGKHFQPGTAKSADTTFVYEINENRNNPINPRYTSWLRYSSTGLWQVPGCWGANDLNLSTDYGYGTGILHRFLGDCVDFGDSLVICEGTIFTDRVKNLLAHDIHGANHYWVFHDNHGSGDATPGSWQVSGYNYGTQPEPVMRVYGHREVATRSRFLEMLRAYIKELKEFGVK